METVSIKRVTRHGTLVEFIVDAEYWDKKGSKHCWTYDGDGYLKALSKYKMIKMQRDVYQFFHPDVNIDSCYIDHINHNIHDNRIGNLRISSNQQNQYNRVANKLSRYKGVSWHKHDQRWRAQIRESGKKVTIGYYKSEYEAALAYNNKAMLLHGEFACINFV